MFRNRFAIRCVGFIFLAAQLLILLSGCMPPDAQEAYAPTSTPPNVTASVTAPIIKHTSEPTSAPDPSPTPKPAFTLQLVQSGSFQIPYALYSADDSAVNAALSAYYGQWITWLTAASQGGSSYTLTYLFSMSGSLYNIRAILRGKGGSFTLPDVALDPQRGTVAVPEGALPEHGGFSDTQYVDALLTLGSYDLIPDWRSLYAEPLSKEEAFTLLTGAYTALTGDIIITQGAELPDCGITRAAVLGLLSPSNARLFYEADQSGAETYGVEGNYFIQMLSKLSALAERHLCGRYGDAVTDKEALTCAITYLSYWGQAAGVEGEAGWQSALQKAQAAASSYPYTAQSLTRVRLSAVYVNLYENSGFGAIDEVYWSTLPDTDDVNARKTYGLYLMASLPGSRYFSPAYTVTVHDLYDWTADFVCGYADQWVKSDHKSDLLTVSGRNALVILADWMRSFSSRGSYDLQVDEIDNPVSWDWYVNQYDGSEYASFNCMPAMTCMAMKWLDPSYPGTPANLRQEIVSPTRGWRMAQVEEVLQDENVAYFIRNLSLENMVQDLDAGRILLIQINEGNLTSDGHCLVVYGYRRWGNSLLFLIQDPGISADTTLFGESVGKDLEMDSLYLLLISQRFTASYLAVKR